MKNNIKFKASEDMMLREIAGEYLLIPVGALALKVHGMVNLSESGRYLWEKLQKECDEQDLINALLAEYDVDPQTAAEDVRELLDKLDAIGILIIGNCETRNARSQS